ncbi:MAG TPA: Ig-like domain-containing protein, partial [Gemmatimonadales bacterium]|nr:Ig-like domain-containing protein [Gemmatimonadales bacterium]
MIVQRLSLPFALALPLVFAACGGDGLTLPPEGEAANITVMDGNGQSGRVGETLGKPLVVQVTDTRDRPVEGATVIFAFSAAAAGQATPPSATTNADGIASATLTLGSTPGTVTGSAEVPVDAGITPVVASFTAIALSDDAHGIAPVSGDAQSAPVNSPLPLPLVVQVTDQFGNPVPGVTISWSAEGGGSVSEASTVTGPDGQTSVTRTLGGTAGQQATLAIADGLAGSPVTFSHTATAGGASSIVKISGDGQTVAPGSTIDVIVEVRDENNNPVPSAPVTWLVGEGGGSVSPQNNTTDAQGRAAALWTVGASPGANTLNVVSIGATAIFTATATAGAPSAANSSVLTSPSTISAGTGTSTITVTVRDEANNPVAGASVVVASSGSENTINPASATTGSNGVATFIFSSTVAETKTITATAAGVPITDDATITVQTVSSLLEITSDDPDASTVNEEVTVEFTARGSGGTPTGDVVVTVSGGTETCTGTLSNGSGSCKLTLVVPGLVINNNRRVITASYGGDSRFSGDTDSE